MSTANIIAIAIGLATIAFDIYLIVDENKRLKERMKRFDALEESYRKRHDSTPQT